MSRLITPCVLTEGLQEHEAFQAWRQVRSDDGEPRRIEVLQGKKKTTVYRLSGIGPDVDSVVSELLTAGPQAVREAKRLLRPLGASGVELAEIAARLRTSEEGQEGLRAFLERRKPTWID